MERNAVNLALAGLQYFQSGPHTDTQHTDPQGISIAVENFSAFTSAIGGGIWFEPYALNPNLERVCFYAFYDPVAGVVRHDPDYNSEEYDYHSQVWYTSIASRIDGRYSTAWTVPYFDDLGTLSLMTTVGTGIFDEHGQFAGMSTVDWQIQSVIDRLSGIRPTTNSFVLLASILDDYIISNTYDGSTEQIGSPLKNLVWYDDLVYGDNDSVNMGRLVKNNTEYLIFSRLLDNGWLFSVQIPAREIFMETERRNNEFIVIISASFLILLSLASYLLSRLINSPLQKLTAGVAELGGGNLDKQIEVNTKDEIGILAIAFNKMTVDLKASIEQNTMERAEKERISAELNIAADIQSSMLPKTFPAFPGRNEFDIYATMQPAREVGGDFYDFFLIDSNTLAVVIADVSGKGIPAALFMVVAKMLIKNNAQSGKNPKKVLETVNNMLCENNEANMFVTAFLGFLDIPSGKFTFVNAGHNPPLLKRSGSDFNYLKAKPGLLLAAFEETSYLQHEITLEQGDIILLYTDGVTDAVDNEEKMFSDAKLLDTVNACKDLSLEDFLYCIRAEIDLFANGAEQADDITMLVLNIRERQKNPPKNLTIKALVENLDTVMDFINNELENISCSPEFLTQIGISSEEVFVNICNYAYGDQTGDVTIRINTGDIIIIEFEDTGIEFNPLDIKNPDMEASAIDRETGGLGIFMVKQIMDTVEYRRENNKNILVISKSINQSKNRSIEQTPQNK